MNEEELLLALEYLLLKRRIRERKQLKAKDVRKMWARDVFQGTREKRHISYLGTRNDSGRLRILFQVHIYRIYLLF